MKAAGDCPLTAVTFVAALSGSADIGSIYQTQAIHCCIRKSSSDSSVTISNALIDSYSKGGCPDCARKIFDYIRNRDVYSWTSMISGYAFHSQGTEALAVFRYMLESGAIPNTVTFLSVLTACSHGGLLVEAQKVFYEMIHTHHLYPRIEHYGCIVDLLGRVGRIEEAVEFVNKMPITPDAVIWRSLLSASLVNGNLGVAEMAGQKAIELQPDDDGVYAMLHNVYWAAGRSGDALKVRKMASQKVCKKPAFTWVEINGIAHGFLAEHAASIRHWPVEVQSVVRQDTWQLNDEFSLFLT
ncbi:unnamed protein product [Linum tenue]|nr:unnamed protein product [Linum tenue]